MRHSTVVGDCLTHPMDGNCVSAGPCRLRHKAHDRGLRVRGGATVLVGLMGWLAVGCSTNTATPAQPVVSDAADPSSSEPETTTSPPSVPPATSRSTTPTTTDPPGPPVYDPQRLGDVLDLASFVLTVTVDNTNSGQLAENITTLGYVQEPISMYRLATFSGSTDTTRKYLVDGRTYEENQFGDWYLYEVGSRAAPAPSANIEFRSSILAGVLTAQLVGQEDFAGLPANHFVFNETNTSSFSYYTPENPSPAVEGDFFLAQEGNYVLYAHSKESSPGRVYEVTEAMSFIGQVGEITLPDDMAPMSQALDVGVDLTSVLPPGSALSELLRYTSGIGIDYYTYVTSLKNNDEFINFYRTMPPTNGWTVAHIGHITPHLEPTNCESRNECVILQNGGEQVVVSFAGTIMLEYDREHVFSPL